MTGVTTKIKWVKYIVVSLLGVILLANTVLAQNPGKRLRERFGGGNELKQQRLEMKQQRLEMKQERFRQQMGKNLNPGFGGGIQARVWARALKLSEEQIIRMRQTMRAAAATYISIQKELQEKRFNLERATFNENTNEDALKQMAIELGKLEGQIAFLKARVQLQIRNILTSEQLKIYNELRFGEKETEFLDKDSNSNPPSEQKNNN